MHNVALISCLFLLLFPIFQTPVQKFNTPSSQSPCEKKSQSHQLDFWIGEWDVTIAGQKTAVSSIQQAMDGCAVLESYSELGGFYGKSINFYDSTLDRWRQTWVDNQGNVSEFVGSFRGGAMRLEGVTHRSEGRTVMRRMTLTPQDRDHVRQFSERSIDEGKTWGVAYDFIYVRKTTAP